MSWQKLQNEEVVYNSDKNMTKEHILYKVVDTKTPHLQKLIVRVINKSFVRGLNITGVFLVRDGFIVKQCNQHNRYLHAIAARIGYKPSIHSKNLGALYKKYGVPKSSAAIIGDLPIYHKVASVYPDMMNVFDGCIDHINAAMSGDKMLVGTRMLFSKYSKEKTIDFMKNLTTKRKIELFGHRFANDIIESYYQITRYNPAVLENFNWKQSLDEIHDSLYRILDRLRNPDRETPIEYTEHTQKAIERANKSLSKSGLTLKLATSGVELLSWGQHLSHCIGGYTNRALRGAKNEACILLGVFEGSQNMPTWTMEMKFHSGMWAIIQFYGVGNKHAPSNIYELVEESLR